MFSLLKKYELRGAKRRVRLFNSFRIESVLKIAPYHTLKFGGIGKMPYLCIVIQKARKITCPVGEKYLPDWENKKENETKTPSLETSRFASET